MKGQLRLGAVPALISFSLAVLQSQSNGLPAVAAVYGAISLWTMLGGLSFGARRLDH